MPTKLTRIAFEALDVPALASFWAAALGWHQAVGNLPDQDLVVGPPDGVGVGLMFVRSSAPKKAKNRLHLELAGGARQEHVVHRLLALGASEADIGQGQVPWVVLADPEGNEFCVQADGDLADPLAGICLDAANPQVQGRFWAAATGWSIAVVADWGVELRSPSGAGPVLIMGPPAAAKVGRNRLRMEVDPCLGDDLAGEVVRLRAEGASLVGTGQPVGGGRADESCELLADPEGNEFCVLGSGPVPGA
jgi:predicted enzyme related to lactoylglutathione lyase